MAWLAGYSKSKPLVITGGASGAQTDFQLKLAVSYEAAMDGEFDDIRFTEADGTTLVDAWAEVIVTDTSATIWVEFPTTPANTVEQTYYMYYGHASPTNYWDIGATFLFGEDFSGDLSKWTQKTGTWSIVDGKLKTPNTSDIYITNEASAITLYDYVAEYRAQWLDTGTDNTFAFNQRMDTGSFGARDGYGGYWRWANNGDRIDEYINGGAFALQTEATNVETTNWHKVKFTANGSALEFYSYDEVTTNNNTVSTSDSTRSSGYLGFTRYGTNRGDTYIDWVFARKYAANPPTYEFGAEQSDPGAAAAPTAIFYGPFVGPLGGMI